MAFDIMGFFGEPRGTDGGVGWIKGTGGWEGEEGIEGEEEREEIRERRGRKIEVGGEGVREGKRGGNLGGGKLEREREREKGRNRYGETRETDRHDEERKIDTDRQT